MKNKTYFWVVFLAFYSLWYGAFLFYIGGVKGLYFGSGVIALGGLLGLLIGGKK